MSPCVTVCEPLFQVTFVVLPGTVWLFAIWSVQTFNVDLPEPGALELVTVTEIRSSVSAL